MILVSGGTGMLGTHLLFNLIKKGEKVRAMKRASSYLDTVKKVFSYYHPDPESIFNKIEWVDADILDVESVNAAMKGVDKVYHVAAIVSFRPSDKIKMIKNNVNGTANMVNAALENNIAKFCHVSSVAALGVSDDESPVYEETFRKPDSDYSGYQISKYLSEMEVWRGIAEGLNAVIVNPSVILGPGYWKTGSPSLFYNVWKGLKFYTKGITGYVDVWDVVKIMESLTESPVNNERFVISAENLSFKELFDLIADSVNKTRPNILVSSFMLKIAWRIEYLRTKITGFTPILTKDTVKAANSISRYSNKKITELLDFKFRTINESVKDVATIFNRDFNTEK
ncbi:MAG: NAD-dependent epimerase/dehydratase family protein [Bacteroidota bacterium]